MLLKLIAQRPWQFEGQTFNVKHNDVMGRGEHANFIMMLPDISRNHCKFFKDQHGVWWIQDLQSTNGTRLNGKKVGTHLLKKGDHVRIGAFEFVID
jgi:pSer/pThr/pTyr-binding forkhead associated (FHA) protein